MTKQESNTHNHLFEKLDKKTLKLLCYLAYHGDETGPSRMETEYRKNTHMSKGDYDKSIDNLYKEGYIQGRTFVHQRWHFSVLKELYTNHKDWLPVFRNIRTYTRSSTAEYLCKVVEYILAGDYMSATSLRRPYIGIGNKQFNLMKYLLSSCEEDIRFMQMLNDNEKQEMTDELLSSRFIYDEVDEELLNTLQRIIPSASPYKEELADEINAYRFLQFGTPFAPNSIDSFWPVIVHAIHLLYAGNLHESIENFVKALRLQGKRAAFSTPLLNYFYGIALYLQNKESGTQTVLSRLRAFRNERTIRYDDENFCIRLLLEGLSGNETEVARGDYILERHHEKLYNSFVFLLYHLFDRPIDQLTPDMLHTGAIIQHEMAAYLPIGPSAKQSFQSFFGGNPLLSRINRRPAWEKKLSAISESMTKIKGLEKRVVYFINGFDLTAIMEQEKIGGEWKDGKVLSLSEMLSNGYDSMDPTDMLIASKLNMGKGYDGAGKIIIPLLANSGRLLHGCHYEKFHEIISVSKERPNLSFEGKGPVIQISTNVETEDGQTPQKHTLRQTGPCSYTLITVNALEKDVLKRFLSIGQLPSSAVISLKPYATHCGNTVMANVKKLRRRNFEKGYVAPFQLAGIGWIAAEGELYRQECSPNKKESEKEK